ncbi:MAG TPA: LamG domain-containing protein [Kofleriaceae bacterium]
MRGVLAVALCGCGFKPSSAASSPVDSTPLIVDAAIDAPGPPDPCAGTLLCLTFEPDPLPDTLPNGGSAPVSAMLTAITRGQGITGGDAEMSSASQIFVPSVPQLSGVFALDYWVRIDQSPSANDRIGMLDSAVGGGFSSFYYNYTTTPEVRCTINGYDLYAYVAPFSGWTHVACSCDAPILTIYVNGLVVASQDQQCAGAATVDPYGIQVGADNVDGAGYTDNILQGALDDVRLYNAPLTAEQVCKLAGTC